MHNIFYLGNPSSFDYNTAYSLSLHVCTKVQNRAHVVITVRNKGKIGKNRDNFVAFLLLDYKILLAHR